MIMISKAVWNEIKNIIPEKETNIGRPRSDSRVVLSGILYVLITGCQWRHLPNCYGKKSTVHGIFMLWSRGGVFEKILKKSIEVAIKILGIPACFFCDTSFSKAPFALFGGKNPTDRRKNGVKRGIVIDMNQIVLSVLVEAANRHDCKLMIGHIKHIEPYLDKPKVMVADSAWDSEYLRKELAKKNIALHASTNSRRNKNKRKIKSGGRWRIEQVFGMQQWNRGMKTCWTKTKEAYLALCQLAAALHNFKRAGVFG
jgi:putative transposase